MRLDCFVAALLAMTVTEEDAFTRMKAAFARMAAAFAERVPRNDDGGGGGAGGSGGEGRNI
jgi:uncharacterized membrane protein